MNNINRPLQNLPPIIWNTLTGALLAGSLCACGFFSLIFFNPQSALNPLPPPTRTAPASAPAGLAQPTQAKLLGAPTLPPVWTPTEVGGPTATSLPTATALSAATVAAAPSPTLSLAPVPGTATVAPATATGAPTLTPTPTATLAARDLTTTPATPTSTAGSIAYPGITEVATQPSAYP